MTKIYVKLDDEDGGISDDQCPFAGSRSTCGAINSKINYCPTSREHDDYYQIVRPSDCPLRFGSLEVIGN